MAGRGTYTPHGIEHLEPGDILISGSLVFWTIGALLKDLTYVNFWPEDESGHNLIRTRLTIGRFMNEALVKTPGSCTRVGEQNRRMSGDQELYFLVAIEEISENREHPELPLRGQGAASGSSSM